VENSLQEKTKPTQSDPERNKLAKEFRKFDINGNSKMEISEFFNFMDRMHEKGQCVYNIYFFGCVSIEISNMNL